MRNVITLIIFCISINLYSLEKKELFLEKAVRVYKLININQSTFLPKFKPEQFTFDERSIKQYRGEWYIYNVGNYYKSSRLVFKNKSDYTENNMQKLEENRFEIRYSMNGEFLNYTHYNSNIANPNLLRQFKSNKRHYKLIDIKNAIGITENIVKSISCDPFQNVLDKIYLHPSAFSLNNSSNRHPIYLIEYKQTMNQYYCEASHLYFILSALDGSVFEISNKSIHEYIKADDELTTIVNHKIIYNKSLKRMEELRKTMGHGVYKKPHKINLGYSFAEGANFIKSSNKPDLYYMVYFNFEENYREYVNDFVLYYRARNGEYIGFTLKKPNLMKDEKVYQSNKYPYEWIYNEQSLKDSMKKDLSTSLKSKE